MANGMTASWKYSANPIPADPVYEKSYGMHSDRTDYRKRDRRSPIPSDPVYSEDNGHSDVAPKPRIKAEALNIARLHQGGALAQIFNPAFRVIPVGTRPSK